MNGVPGFTFAVVYVPQTSELRIVRTADLRYTEKQRCWFNAHCELVGGPEAIIKFMSNDMKECQETRRKRLDEINLIYMRERGIGGDLPSHAVNHNPPTVEDYHIVKTALAEFKQQLSAQARKVDTMSKNSDDKLESMRAQAAAFEATVGEATQSLAASATKYSHRHSDEVAALKKEAAKSEERVLLQMKELDRTMSKRMRTLKHIVSDIFDMQQSFSDEIKAMISNVGKETTNQRGITPDVKGDGSQTSVNKKDCENSDSSTSNATSSGGSSDSTNDEVTSSRKRRKSPPLKRMLMSPPSVQPSTAKKARPETPPQVEEPPYDSPVKLDQRRVQPKRGAKKSQEPLPAPARPPAAKCPPEPKPAKAAEPKRKSRAKNSKQKKYVTGLAEGEQMIHDEFCKVINDLTTACSVSPK